MKIRRISLCVVLVFSGLLLFFALATPWRAAHAQDPTPTPLPTLDPMDDYYFPADPFTFTLEFEWDDFWVSMIHFTPTHELSLTLDVGLWDLGNIIEMLSVGRQFFAMGYVGFLLDILILVVVCLFTVPPVMAFIKQVRAFRARRADK